MHVSLRPAWRPLVIVLAAVGAVLSATIAYGRVRGIELSDLSRDPITVLHGAVHTGFLSGVGVLMSWGSAVVCGVTAYALRRVGDRPGASPLLYLAVFLAVFALDDLFLLHEEIAPKAHLDDVMQIGYVSAALAFAWIYRDFVRSSDRVVAIFALTCLAGSLVLDTAELGWIFVEDSLKLTGIAVLSLYVVRECLQRLPKEAAG
ncbi:MAG TPA: hypothetical protein VFR32_09965 [Gaiellaceae bacterium]|nr:hypothetical protein [Gaiellaceae bacterium]